MFNFPGQGMPPGMAGQSLALNPFALPPGMPGMPQQQQQMAQAQPFRVYTGCHMVYIRYIRISAI